MEKVRRFRGLFWPFALLLAFLGVASMLSLQMGMWIGSGLVKEVPKYVLEVTSIGLFVVLILVFGKKDFRKIFFSSLILIALLFVGSFFAPPSIVPYFFMIFFCPKLLPVLGWCYVNQIADKLEGMKYYFALIFVSGLIMFPFTAMPFFLNFGPSMMLSSALVCLGLVLLFDYWINARRAHA